MREVKFRAWQNKAKRMFPVLSFDEYDVIEVNSYLIETGGDAVGRYRKNAYESSDCFLMQYTGLEDCNGTEYYIDDIGQFDNGDTFILKMEDWLEVFVDWIGEPECEDQARDLYRISSAKIIGNKWENPELLEGVV